MSFSRVLLLSLLLLLCVAYATNAACKKQNDEENENGEFEGIIERKDGKVKGGHEKGEHVKGGKKKGDDDNDGDHEKKGKKKGDDDEGEHEKKGKKKGDDDEGEHAKGGKKKGDDKEGGKKKGGDDKDGGKKKGGDDKEGGKGKGGKGKGDDDEGDDKEGGKGKGGKGKGDDDEGDDKEGGKGKGGKGKGGGDHKKGPIEPPVDATPAEGPVVGPPADVPARGTTGGTTFDVTKFGAKGDGSTQDSAAFLKAWEQVCSSKANFPVLVIPKGNFMLKATEFAGPCNAKAVGVQFDGTIISSPQKSDWKTCEDFISFRNINNLEITGSGGVDGNGAKWWGNQLSCGKRPTSLALNSCTGVKVTGIHSKNSARNHMSISHTSGAIISGITLTAPDQSPNTDGIDISSSSSITIQNSFIGSGDDCVAINKNTKDVTVKNVKCGPGHGISIGSLGRGGELAQVENVFVSNCIFDKTDNGARIKTWKGGRGYVRNVVYRDITLIDVRRPIIIDQNYVDKHHPLANEDSSLSISDVKFINFKGTCRESDAITLSCSSSGSGCTGVELQNINIQGGSGEKPQATCQNANVRAMQSFPPVSCGGQKAGTLDYSEFMALNETD